MSTTTKAAHTPGDVNHRFLAAAGYDFCSECGCSLRGKRTLLEAEMLAALESVNHFAAKFDGVGHRSIEEEIVLDRVFAAIQKAKGGK